MAVVRPAAERFRSEYNGIVSLHCFSAGAHYDPARMSYGDLVGVDEHVVQPGAGFDWHAHRGVLIASWVLSGALRHQDDRGADEVIEPGTLVVQDGLAGLRHRETCASSEPVRFVQLTALSGSFEVVHRTASLDDVWHLFVAGGMWTLDGAALAAGDAVSGNGPAELTGTAHTGTALVWRADVRPSSP